MSRQRPRCARLNRDAQQLPILHVPPSEFNGKAASHRQFASGLRLVPPSAPCGRMAEAEPAQTTQRTDGMNTDQLRELLPITRDRIYMNTGWAGPTPTSALRRMAETLEQEAMVGPASALGVALDREANRAAAAAAAARLLGAAEDDVILTHSTREGVNVVIYGMDWKPGDELLICDLEHPALTTPAKVIAERMGVRVTSAPITTMSTFEESLDLVQLCDNRTHQAGRAEPHPVHLWPAPANRADHRGGPRGRHSCAGGRRSERRTDRRERNGTGLRFLHHVRSEVADGAGGHRRSVCQP